MDNFYATYEFYTLSGEGHLVKAELHVPYDDHDKPLPIEKASTYPWIHYRDEFYHNVFETEEEAYECLEKHKDYAWGPYILLKVVR